MLISTMQQSFQQLIALLVTKNGNGQKELARCVKNGDLSEEEAAVVEFYVCMQKLDKKLDGVLDKL